MSESSNSNRDLENSSSYSDVDIVPLENKATVDSTSHNDDDSDRASTTTTSSISHDIESLEVERETKRKCCCTPKCEKGF